MIYGILSNQIDSVWERIEPLVDAAIQKSHELDLTSGDVLNGLKERDYQLWCINDFEGILVTQLSNDGVLAMVVAGKNMDTWINEVDETLIDFGKAHEKKYIESYSRRGFHKTMLKHKYKVARVVYRKEIK